MQINAAFSPKERKRVNSLDQSSYQVHFLSPRIFAKIIFSDRPTDSSNGIDLFQRFPADFKTSKNSQGDSLVSFSTGLQVSNYQGTNWTPQGHVLSSLQKILEKNSGLEVLLFFQIFVKQG